MFIIMKQDMIHAFSSQATHEPFVNSIRLRRSIWRLQLFLLFFSVHGVGMWLHANRDGSPDSRAFRHCGQSFSLRGFITRGTGTLLDFFGLVNHFMIDLDWNNICKHKTITAIMNIINEGWSFTSCFYDPFPRGDRYPTISPPLPNYQLPIVAIS